MELLPWDTQFFGYTVANVTEPTTLAALKEAGVKLAYVSIPTDNLGESGWLRALNGQRVDTKVTYAMKLEGSYAMSKEITEYTGEMTPQLKSLATQAGEFSRFKVDARIGYTNFARLYQLWLAKSINHELAKAVFVTPKQAGFLTVGIKNGRSDIGLLAVDATTRGKGYGEALVRAAQHWSVAHGLKESQVVTQGNNVAASRLYEKCGYEIESTVALFHVWVD